jgi:hypothetical protein
MGRGLWCPSTPDFLQLFYRLSNNENMKKRWDLAGDWKRGGQTQEGAAWRVNIEGSQTCMTWFLLIVLPVTLGR